MDGLLFWEHNSLSECSLKYPKYIDEIVMSMIWLLQVPSRKGEYIFGVAPCLASLLTKRRKIHKILLKRDILVKDISLKKLVNFDHSWNMHNHKLLYNVCRLTMDKINAHVHQYDTKLYYVEKEKLDRISGKNAHQVKRFIDNLQNNSFHAWCVIL